jgi:NAD(P)-dependent dehydrogenase (short-subunit alcohol dehydrogenase family)
MQSRTALVTGASSGIGEAAAERLAMAGYKVYGTTRRAAEASQRSFKLLPLDVTSDKSVETTVLEVLRLEGRIDLLVNNAGFGIAPGAGTRGSFAHCSDQPRQRASTPNGSRHLLPQLHDLPPSLGRDELFSPPFRECDALSAPLAPVVGACDFAIVYVVER